MLHFSPYGPEATLSVSFLGWDDESYSGTRLCLTFSAVQGCDDPAVLLGPGGSLQYYFAESARAQCCGTCSAAPVVSAADPPPAPGSAGGSSPPPHASPSPAAGSGSGGAGSGSGSGGAR